MYKMIIVDDNPRDRRGIKTITDWNSMEIEIIGDCSNGTQALNLMEEHNPDIILTDISMPVMNGIEMAKILKKSHPDTKIIFMSCYYEFDYAKSAIDLDVYGYIVKPFEEEEIVKAIEKVLNIFRVESSLQKEREEMIKQLDESIPILREQFLRDLLFCVNKDQDNINEKSTFFNMPTFINKSIGVISLEINEYKKITDSMDITDKYLTTLTIKKIIEEFIGEAIMLYSIQISSSEFAVILICNIKPELALDIVLDTAISIKEVLKKKFDLETSIGISKISDKLSELYKLYQQSVKALKTKYFSDGNQVILYEEIEDFQSQSFEEKINFHQLFKEIKELIFTDDMDDIYNFIDIYLNKETTFVEGNYIKSFTFSLVNIIQIILIEMNESFDNIFNGNVVVWQKLYNFETIKDIKNWIFNIINSCREHIVVKYNPRNMQIVNKIKEIIQSRYSENLTLFFISNSINFSPSQANRIFKSETGGTIFDYLIEYRMQKAKELLNDPSSKIYEVSDQVGYTNKSHFCLLFKKYMGVSPTEYKNSLTL